MWITVVLVVVGLLMLYLFVNPDASNEFFELLSRQTPQQHEYVHAPSWQTYERMETSADSTKPAMVMTGATELRTKATKIYDDILTSFQDKIESIDYQLDHPDLFRTDFEPAAKFYEQFQETKTAASLSNAQPANIELARRFLKAAETSDTLWGEAVAASSISLQDGTTSLSSTDKAVLKRVHGTIALATDKATPDDTRADHWEWVAKLLAQLNMNAMHPEARMALKRAIREPELSITTGHIPNLPELDAA